MRNSASAFLQAARARDKRHAANEKVVDFGKVLTTISPFLKLTNKQIMAAVYDLKSDDQLTPKLLMRNLNILEDVEYVRYTGDEVDIHKVLWDLPKTPLFTKFCKLLSNSSTGQVVLIAVLKGLVSVVLTNKAIKPYPGCYFHKIISADEKLNDVLMFKLEELPLFLAPEQFHNN